MENIGGSLGFRATLNIDDFNVSALAMERQIKNFSDNAISEVGQVEDSFRHMAEKAGQYISYYLVGQGMHGLLNSVIQTRGQFQQLEIAFETMLGDGSKAHTLMLQMIDTAAKTPFDLLGVAEGAKQLMAYGVSAEKVNDTLVRLGNIASGLSIPLNDIVYLYGTTMVQGRLYAQDVRQFTGRGIPLVKELAEKYHKTTDEINAMVSAGKVGFKDVEEVLNKNDKCRRSIL
ncbi:tape measure protein [Barnesiella sp. WM24]|uniref:tape measure protein n=1 Tax=Barnesiella sp. WM24 TaxID=2558278 RepID=UPI001FD74F41|nr:tape measure protein [Barnesiella sp. WM24]